MTPDNPSLYEVLGIPPQASPTQIKEAWRTTAKATHPDAGGTNEAFTTAQHAWEVLSDPEQRAAYDAALSGEDASDQEALDGTVDVDPLAEWPWCVPFLEATPRLRHPCPGIVESVVVAAAGIMTGIGWHELLKSLVVAPGFVGAWWVISVPLVVAVTWLAAVTGLAFFTMAAIWCGWSLIGGALLWGQTSVVWLIAAGWLAWLVCAWVWWNRHLAWSSELMQEGNLYGLPEEDPLWGEAVELVAGLIPSVRAMWSHDGQTVTVSAGRRVATLGMPMRGWRGIEMRGWNPVGADTWWIVDQVGSWLVDQDEPMVVDGRVLHEAWERSQMVRSGR
ncbi:chaperone protein DnaJ [Cutibacterium acnes HL099PA1]|uniref:J domain-containing protein n=1 Tax=Cutibacterium acnes TaxID=1747 RepID=UPI00020630E7|nr:J domain-containing protein [Cutibacterium acnes]EGF75759.1 chaperone protein DnaJ [Cutibacterium acnes HL099PA1]